MRFTPILGAIALVASMAGPAAGQQKFGFVDSRQLMAEAPGAQEASSTLEQEMRGFQQRIATMQDSLQKAMQQYQQRAQMLTPEARQAEEQKIGQLQQTLQQSASQLEAEASQRQETLMKPVMDRIQAAIDAVRQEGGYTMILDAASGAFLSADPSVDLTQAVLERLQADAQDRDG